MANLAGPSPPTEEQWDALVQSVKESLVEEEVGSEAWYLIIVSVKISKLPCSSGGRLSRSFIFHQIPSLA